jgi:hypothetical protein
MPRNIYLKLGWSGPGWAGQPSRIALSVGKTVDGFVLGFVTLDLDWYIWCTDQGGIHASIDRQPGWSEASSLGPVALL